MLEKAWPAQGSQRAIKLRVIQAPFASNQCEVFSLLQPLLKALRVRDDLVQRQQPSGAGHASKLRQQGHPLSASEVIHDEGRQQVYQAALVLAPVNEEVSSTISISACKAEA